MTRIATAAIVAALSVGTAQASDFSKLAEPAFASSLLISPERRVEMMCVGAARANAALKRGWSRRTVAAFARPILDRYAKETGDTVEATSDNADTYNVAIDLDFADEALKKERLADLEMWTRECKPYFDTFRSGGTAALRAKLKPASGLIPLLGLPYCLAVIRQPTDAAFGTMFGKDEVAEVDRLARGGLDKADRTVLDAAVASEEAKLKTASLSQRLVGVHQLACLATFRQLAPNR